MARYPIPRDHLAGRQHSPNAPLSNSLSIERDPIDADFDLESKALPDPGSDLQSPSLHVQSQFPDASFAFSHFHLDLHFQTASKTVSGGQFTQESVSLRPSSMQGDSPGNSITEASANRQGQQSSLTQGLELGMTASNGSILRPAADLGPDVQLGHHQLHSKGLLMYPDNNQVQLTRTVDQNQNHKYFYPHDVSLSAQHPPDNRHTFRSATPVRHVNRELGQLIDAYSGYYHASSFDSPIQQRVDVQNQNHVHYPQQSPISTASRFHALQQANITGSSTTLEIVSGFPKLPVPLTPVSPSNSTMSEQNPKKKMRIDAQQQVERNLLLLASKLSGEHLSESALKVRQINTDSSRMVNDPIFGPLCNSKDIRHDRHHQVFALAWLHQTCEVSPTSAVPRNHIYSRYVQMCGEFILSPLMPATFGRLVRILFPNLTSRRLGMRGKSKYHYCGIQLKGDNVSVDSPMSTYSSGAVDSPHSNSFHTPVFTESPGANQMFATPVSFVNVQEHFYINDFKYIPGLYEIIEKSILGDHENNSLSLPSIYAYLPKDFEFDTDVADTLLALVKIQCTSMFELIRFMRKDNLFFALVPLSAILQGPPLRLLNNDFVVEWVKRCDLATYRAMLKLLSRLIVNCSNKDIVAVLREITLNYVGRLSNALGDRFSRSFKGMKLRLARQFIKIVGRLLRCIETGARAAMVLTNAGDRNLMLLDWSKLNYHDTILREIPCGPLTAQAIINILEVQVVQLLSETTHTSSPLPKYATFLFELPQRFPRVNPWLFSLLLSNLLTAFIREMSMVGSRSFKSWWIVGCWINEYMSWSFELGGYLYEDFFSSQEGHQKALGSDMGMAGSSSAGTEGIFPEKMFSTVGLLGGSNRQV